MKWAYHFMFISPVGSWNQMNACIKELKRIERETKIISRRRKQENKKKTRDETSFKKKKKEKKSNSKRDRWEEEEEKYSVMYCWSEEINLQLPCTHGGKNIYTGQKLSLLDLKVEASGFYRVRAFRGFELFNAFFGGTREYYYSLTPGFIDPGGLATSFSCTLQMSFDSRCNLIHSTARKHKEEEEDGNHQVNKKN